MSALGAGPGRDDDDRGVSWRVSVIELAPSTHPAVALSIGLESQGGGREIRHQTRLDLFCETCECVCCRLCILGEHEHHAYKLLAGGLVESERDIMRAQIEQLRGLSMCGVGLTQGGAVSPRRRRMGDVLNSI